MSRIRVRPGLDDDILALAVYLIDRSEEMARRFVDAAQKGLKDMNSLSSRSVSLRKRRPM